MRLLAVYGIKTDDSEYFKQFYPSRRLSEECANRSIPLRFLFPCDVPGFLEKSSASVTIQDSVRNTVCLIRGIVSADTVRLLEKAGYRCVNPSFAIELANDKLETARFVERNGWPTPRTVAAAEALSGFPGEAYPLVAKPRFGSRGVGVHLVYGAEEVSRLIAPEKSLPDASGNANFIVQEYVASSAGRDLRVFFAGNKIIAVAERRSRDGSFISNACAGGSMIKPYYGTNLGEPWKKMIHDIAAASGLWYGTVDFLYRKDEDAVFVDGGEASRTGPELDLTICELNASPGFEALEKDCGYNIAGMLVDALVAEFGS